MLYLIVNTIKTPQINVKDIHEKMTMEWPKLGIFSNLNFNHFNFKHYLIYKSNYFSPITINLLINLDEKDQNDIEVLFCDDNTKWTYNRYIGSKPIINLKNHDGAIVAHPNDLASAIYDFFSFSLNITYICVDANDYLTITQNKILYYHQTDNLKFKLKFENRSFSQSTIIKQFNLALYVYNTYESELDTITMDDIGEGYDRVHKKWPEENLKNSQFIYTTFASPSMGRYGLYWEAQSCSGQSTKVNEETKLKNVSALTNQDQ